MKRYIKAGRTLVDLSEELAIGEQCIDKLRKEFPEIPAKVRHRRSRAWSRDWYIVFDLGLDVRGQASQYAEDCGFSYGSPEYTDCYWQYIYDFEDKCKKITHTPEFYNDKVQCSAHYFDFDDKYPGAVLEVYALTKPSRTE